MQVNFLERARSGDIMDLQAMAARQVVDLFMWISAVRMFKARALDPNDQPRSLVGGLSVDYFGTLAVTVNPGFLAQIDSTAIAQGALDSAMVVGFLREPVQVDLPDNAGREAGWHYDLLSARVIEVVTENEVLDIFDVPTQTFQPVAKDKRIELRLEFKWTVAGPNSVGLSTLSTSPALDDAGDGWTPIAFVNNPTRSGRLEIFMVAPCLADYLGAAELGASRSASLATDYAAKLQSVTSPHNPVNTVAVNRWVHGMLRGGLQGSRAHFAALQENESELRAETDGSAFLVNQLQHLYLCPLKHGERLVYPVRPSSIDTEGLTQGILVRSLVQPTFDFRNSEAIKIGGPDEAGNRWAAQPEVAIGDALYVGSGYSSDASASDWRNAVQARSGELRFELGEATDLPDTVQMPLLLTMAGVSDVGDPEALAQAAEIDLRSKVPRCATHVILHIETRGNTTEQEYVQYEVRQRVNDPLNSVAPVDPNAGRCLARITSRGKTHEDDVAAVDLVVPVGWVPYPGSAGGDANDGEVDYHLRWLFCRQNSNEHETRPVTYVFLAGWIL